MSDEGNGTDWEKSYEDELNKLQLEITKLLLSSSVDFIRNTSQVLQALTGLLLTSYVTLFVGVIRQGGLPSGVLPTFAYLLPPLIFALSLILSFVRALQYAAAGFSFTFGDLDGTVNTYKEVLRKRRQDLILPFVLTLLGVVIYVFVGYQVIL